MKSYENYFKVLGVCILLFLVFGSTFLHSQPMSGNYTVGGNSPDFLTLQDAAHSLFINGISGPVNINIRPGTYFREGSPGPVLLLDSVITGLSNTSRLTFQPDAATGGNVSNVILAIDCDSSTDYNTNREVVYILQDYITLRNLTFLDADFMDTPSRYLVRTGTGLNSGNSSIEGLVIDGCKLIGEPPYIFNNQTWGTLNGFDGSNITDAVITDNQFSNSERALFLNFDSGPGDYLELNNNHVEGLFNHNGSTAIYAGFLHIFVRRNYVDAIRFGLEIASPLTGIIEANYINAAQIGGDVLYVNGHNVTDSLVIKNNILIRKNLGQVLDLETRNTKILHNTFINAGPNGNTTIVIGGSQCALLNNIILTYNNSIALDVGTPDAANIYSDHNVFFKSGQQGYFAKLWGGSGFFYTQTFEEYQSASGLDSNSTYTDVTFEDSLGLRLEECSAQNTGLIGVPLSQVPVDFYGALRDSLKPFIGAVEGVRIPFDMFGDPYRSGLQGFATTIAEAKFDNSSAPGIAVPDYDNNAVYLFRNNGVLRTFNLYSTLFPSFPPTIVHFFDLDSDGNTDLIVAGETTDIEIWWGEGSGNFSGPNTIQTFGLVHSIKAGPTNASFASLMLTEQDGLFSYVGFLMCDNSRFLCHDVLRKPGGSFFDPPVDTVFSVMADFVRTSGDPNQHFNVAALTLDFPSSVEIFKDIKPVSDATAFCFENRFEEANPIGELLLGTGSYLGNNSNIVLGDFDNDGDDDIISTGGDDNNLIFMKNQGDFTFTTDTVPTSASRGLVKLDYENDGDLDIVTINNTLDSLGVTVFLNDGAGNFEEIRNCFLPFASGQPFGLVAADFDEDGMTDIAMVSRSIGPLDSLFVLYNLGGFNQTTDIGNPHLVEKPPENFFLFQNFPNPFNPSTTINFSIPQTHLVNLNVYNILGEKVKTLVDEEKSAGNYSVQFNANNLASGIYFYRLQAGSFVQTKKMLLIR